MYYRFMRVIVFFDLPTYTHIDKKNYRNFRKHLLTNGFIMLQESVYSKLVLNHTAVKTILNNLNKTKPPEGLVQVLTITEKQYSQIQNLVGESRSDVVDSDSKLVIL